jgi:molecular chaperone DnaK (HSP70)
MDLLHIYSDSSKLYKMSALSLSRIPIWKGNRIIDLDHVKNIKESINHNAPLLDSGYKIIQYDEVDNNEKPIKQSYLIDGQHRMSVVNDYFENMKGAKDFHVTVTEIRVDSEADAIEYFNKINNVKPIHFKEDPKLIVNKYIQRLINSYPIKSKFFRNGITKRPYISVDKFREALVKRSDNLKKISIEKFIKECKLMNTKIIQELELRSLNDKEKEIKIIIRILELDFALAWDDKFSWLDNILQ